MTRQQLLKELVEYQAEMIRDLDDAEINKLVLEGFPAYGKMSTKKLQAEHDEIFRYLDCEKGKTS